MVLLPCLASARGQHRLQLRSHSVHDPAPSSTWSSGGIVHIWPRTAVQTLCQIPIVSRTHTMHTCTESSLIQPSHSAAQTLTLLCSSLTAGLGHEMTATLAQTTPCAYSTRSGSHLAGHAAGGEWAPSLEMAEVAGSGRHITSRPGSISSPCKGCRPGLAAWDACPPAGRPPDGRLSPWCSHRGLALPSPATIVKLPQLYRVITSLAAHACNAGMTAQAAGGIVLWAKSLHSSSIVVTSK